MNGNASPLLVATFVIFSAAAYSAPLYACSAAGPVWNVSAIEGESPNCLELHQFEINNLLLQANNGCDQPITLGLSDCKKKNCSSSCESLGCRSTSWTIDSFDGKLFRAADWGIDESTVSEDETLTANVEWSTGSNSGTLAVDVLFESAGGGCEDQSGCAGCLGASRIAAVGHATVLLVLLTTLGAISRLQTTLHPVDTDNT